MNGSFLLEEFRIETRANRIHGAGRTVQLEPKIMQVLVRLARCPGEVVSKDELIQSVWPETSATDDVLARAISELRKALGDDPSRPRFIETIRKGGYRLLPRVRPEGDTPSQRRSWAWIAAAGVLLAGGFGLGRLVDRNEPPAINASEPLTSYRGVEKDPALAPFGQRVAFSWNGPDQDNWDIYVKLPGEETPQRLTQSPLEDGSPAWSPDGDRIAFRRRGDGRCEVLVVPAIGGQERVLAGCSENRFADLTWSADGRWLAHNDAIGDGRNAIVLIDADSGVARPLTDPPGGIWGDYDPAFSPDGRRLAFARALSEGIQDLFVVDLDGGNLRRLTEDHRNLYGLVWTPDGEHILFASNRGGDYDLWKIAAAAGPIEPVLSGPDDLVNPTLDRDGATLVYEHRRYDTDLWRFQRNPGPGAENPVRSVSSTRWELYPALSSSGQRLAHASDRSGSYELWVSDLDGGSPRRLTDFGGPLTSAPAWSPDDQWLAFDARPDGHADIYLVDPDGGRPRRLTVDRADDVAPSWTADGSSVLFASNRSGRWQVWRVAADGSRLTQVTRDGGFRAIETPQGLFYSKVDEPGLWRLDQGSETRVLDGPDPVDWGNWQVDEAGIYRVDRSRGTAVVMLHPWQGAAVEVFDAGGFIPLSDAALSVAGDTIVFGRIEASWVDLVRVPGPRL